MISKDAVVDRLKTLGYDAYLDGGVVMVKMKKVPTDKEDKQLKKAIHDTGYNSSWGWKVKYGKQEVH